MLKKSQSITEYVLLISIVIAAITGMSLYVQRAVQGRVKDLTDALIAPQSDHLNQLNEIIPLLDTADPNLMKMTYTEVHLEQTTQENYGVRTVTRQTPQGYANSVISDSAYMVVDDPTIKSYVATMGADKDLDTNNVAGPQDDGVN